MLDTLDSREIETEEQKLIMAKRTIILCSYIQTSVYIDLNPVGGQK